MSKSTESKATESDRVFDSIVSDIFSGLIRPRERLSERELVARYGVSRTPVREAIKVLAHEGLLDCPLRRGVSVRAVDPALHDEARALHEILHAHARHTRDIAPQQGALLPVLMELVEQRLRHTRSRAAGIGTAHREQARQPA